MAFAAPLVMSDVGGFGELHRRDGVGELVAPGDAAGLAAALARVLGDDGLRASLRARAAVAADGPLGWGAIAERTEAVYRELA
jgi:glycosyltransferase involved in cell wall biosynthesis